MLTELLFYNTEIRYIMLTEVYSLDMDLPSLSLKYYPTGSNYNPNSLPTIRLVLGDIENINLDAAPPYQDELMKESVIV